jgi:hypothetical protein
MYVHISYLGESNGKLPLRTCPGCSVPEPYRSPDWALVPVKPAQGLNTHYYYILFIIIIEGILILFIHITRLASKEIFSPSNKIRREVCRAKDLSAPRYCKCFRYTKLYMNSETTCSKIPTTVRPTSNMTGT